MAHKSEVGVIEFLEDDRVSTLVWVTLESCLPEGLLYQFPVWSKAALFTHPKHRAELGKSRVRQNFTILERNIQTEKTLFQF